MPSLAELCVVYRNRETINESLAKIHGLENSYADSSLGTWSFWSSSQDSYYYMYMCAWNVYFDNGNVDYSNKSSEIRVCCLAGF